MYDMPCTGQTCFQTLWKSFLWCGAVMLFLRLWGKSWWADDATVALKDYTICRIALPIQAVCQDCLSQEDWLNLMSSFVQAMFWDGTHHSVHWYSCWNVINLSHFVWIQIPIQAAQRETDILNPSQPQASSSGFVWPSSSERMTASNASPFGATSNSQQTGKKTTKSSGLKLSLQKEVYKCLLPYRELQAGSLRTASEQSLNCARSQLTRHIQGGFCNVQLLSLLTLSICRKL